MERAWKVILDSEHFRTWGWDTKEALATEIAKAIEAATDENSVALLEHFAELMH